MFPALSGSPLLSEYQSMSRASRWSLLPISLALMGASFCATSAELPNNLGGGLRPLLNRFEADHKGLMSHLQQDSRIGLDEQKRVRVDIYADGKVPLSDLGARLEKLEGSVSLIYPGYRHGVITAYLPMDKMASAARLPGVSSVILAYNPVTNVGAVTSQGAVVIHSDSVNQAGIDGTGITVGVMSDTYNRLLRGATRAADDVANGDLPNLTNTTNANSPGVKFLIEGPIGGTDEGRGMAQIVYDVAPGADLCFATAYNSQTQFAANIVTLRTDPACLANVIVDDIIYYAEPMFSDGVIAQAVDEVSTSSDLDGRKVAYFSSAGNSRPGYTSEFRMVSDADARGTVDADDTSVDLTTIPSSIDTSGGFHNFDPDGGVDISQEITCESSSCTMVMQWDDPFDMPSGMTTDFNVLIFDTSGNYVSTLSMTDDNFSTAEPIEISSTSLSADTSYRVVIARTGSGSHLSEMLKYVVFGGTLDAEYLDADGANASTYGHNSAANGNGVAAYIYDDIPGDDFTPSLESFSSWGPTYIYFDTAGNRLAEPEIRKNPHIAAPDGANTSFFPAGPLSSTDYEGDGFPNFFGTSAAAPHAAGAAALLIQQAGGPGKLSPNKVRNALENTAPPRDIDPTFSQWVKKKLILTATGANPFDPNFFRIELTGGSRTLVSLVIDVTKIGLQFDPDPTNGYPLTVGASSGPVLTSTPPSSPTSVLTLTFSGFTKKNWLTFGIDRDVAAIAGYGNSADLLSGAKITATFDDGTVWSGKMVNEIGTGYIPADGYGLIDVEAAAASVTAP